MEAFKEIKCLVWDLDNTLWEGVLLESENVHLKPGILSVIQELDNRGILQAIASKNNHEHAWKKLCELNMDQYFLAPQIHWSTKSKSIGEIAKDLDIGLDTIAFIDDQPFERDEVSSVHEVVQCFDALEYDQLLDHPRFNPKFITSDSKRRRLMYVEDACRKKAEEEFVGPNEKFLGTLQMQFIITEAREKDLKRAQELTVRTNQLNATGRTYSYDELLSFMHSDQHKLYVCELDDIYGSYGKIGIALVEINDDNWHLKMMLMSCRVLSKSVGSVLMTYILKQTRENSQKLLADFQQTERNRMMYITYRFANFTEVSNDGKGGILFENDLAQIQPFPPYIDVITPRDIPV